MNTYQEALDAYMASTEPERCMLETEYGLIDGADPRPRFEMAMCPQCTRFADVLPARAVTPEKRTAWKEKMQSKGLVIIGEYYRMRYREGCVCEDGNVVD